MFKTTPRQTNWRWCTGSAAAYPDYRPYAVIIAGGGAFTLTAQEYVDAHWHAASTRCAVYVTFSPSIAGCGSLPSSCSTRGRCLCKNTKRVTYH